METRSGLHLFYFIRARGLLRSVDKFHNSLDSLCQSRGILTASLSEMRLTTATSLDVLGSLANNLSGIKTGSNHILAEHDVQ